MTIHYAEVPCNGCTLCCRGDHIRILPHEDASQWRTVPHTQRPGERMLERNRVGDCVYLGEAGCTIQDTKPEQCKAMDCRNIARALTFSALRKSGVPVQVWKRGRELLEAAHEPVMPMDAQKAAIAIEPWKLPIFERHLLRSGYSFKNAGLMTEDTMILQVVTTNVQALGEVLKAATAECAMTGKP